LVVGDTNAIIPFHTLSLSKCHSVSRSFSLQI
jgi:hypothetical protein